MWDDSWDVSWDIVDPEPASSSSGGPNSSQPAASAWSGWDSDDAADDVSLSHPQPAAAAKKGPGRPKGTTGTAAWRKVVNLF